MFMTRVVVISLLLTVIYSWEECKRAARVLFFGLLRRRAPGKYYAAHLDQWVSILIMFATIPLGLSLLLTNGGNVFTKMTYLLGLLLAVSAVAAFSGALLRHIYFIGAPLRFSSIAAPMIALFAETAVLPRKTLAKFAVYLALPPLTGLTLRAAHGFAGTPSELLPNINLLIVVLVIALFLRVAIDFLETHFRLYCLKQLSAFVRVAAGIALVASLALGLVE